MSDRVDVTPDLREQMRELGRRGVAVRMRNKRERERGQRPYAEPFLTFLEATGRGGPSRAVWRVFWKAVEGLPLDDAELPVFRLHTGRETAPTAPVRECWIPAGRRAGKSEQMITRATWRAISRDWRALLAPGEVGVIPLVASDREQSRNSLAYLKGLAGHPLVKPYVERVLKDSVNFRTGAQVRIATASWRSTRGYTMLDAVLEECAFYQVEGSANPDEEILTAIRPALLTVPGARIYGISSPYAQRGILWRAYERYWGHADADVLVFSADSLSLNPLLDQSAIARAFEEDPQAAASEYGRDGLVAFRSDVEPFLSPEVIDAARVRERFELPPAGHAYVAFVDPSGGSQDSFTLAIAHAEGERAVLDVVREVRPRFSPDDVCREFAAVLKTYHVFSVQGDHYSAEWVRERFQTHGVTYRSAERTKSEIYAELLPLMNSRRVALLDLPRLRVQLLALDRSPARGGRDSIDHPPGAHDDVANAAAGALVAAVGGGTPSDLVFPTLYRSDGGSPELAHGAEYGAATYD